MKSNTVTIDLILPGLLNLPLHELNSEVLFHSTPELHKLLRFADRVNTEVSDFDDIIIKRLGLQQPALPYAKAVNPGTDQQQILFKPVYLKTDINNAIVFPIVANDQDLRSLINDFGEFFKDDCSIQYLSDNCWQMTLFNCQPVTEVPHYLTALGKKVTHYIDQAKTNLLWFKLFNEMQMFLYQHDINQQRQKEFKPPINSLWCWGGDSYQGEKIDNTLWFSDDTTVQKMGDLYLQYSATLDDIRQTDINSDTVIIDLSILRSLKDLENTDIMPLLESIENNYLKSLLSANKYRVVVHTGSKINFYYGGMSRFKFWKKPMQLSEVILQCQAQ